jgi:mannose-1-phosphate guanylyltransferase
VQRVVVIMAGGAGQRFWPLSKEHHPKQLLRLADPRRSLLEQAVERGAAMVGRDRVFVVTARHLVEPVLQAGTGLEPQQVLGEPCKRNTGGCLIYAAAVVLARLGLPPEEVTMGVLTADQRIQEQDAFHGTLTAAFDAAEKHAAIVTVGIQPSRPETGYGYIETGTNTQPIAGAAGRFPVYPVLRFHEKPDAETAQHYVAQGGFYWNSGMFFWNLGVFLNEFQHANPLYSKIFHELSVALAQGDTAAADAAFARLPDRSIDYALLEGARKVLVALGRFAWDDLGSWDALERSLPADGRGNVLSGDPVVIDTQNSIIYNGPGNQRMAVAVLGVRDLVVVVSEDGVLVVPKSQAQRVKEVVEELRRRGAPQA